MLCKCVAPEQLMERVMTARYWISEPLKDSVVCKALQVADLLAWSAGKHVRGDFQFWNIVSEKVVNYEVLRREYW